MITGVSLVVFNKDFTTSQTITAQPTLQWAVKPGTYPLDLQLDLDKRQTINETPIKDSVNIRDSVRIVEKIKWKTRYKPAQHPSAEQTREKRMAVTPDSMSNLPYNLDGLVREEKTIEPVDTPKVSSIQLIVDDRIVYDSKKR